MGKRAGVRIIGGTHRGRRLKVPAGVEVRPTADRIRETLFNWLAPRLVGARCLDLFAGSGALGLEAASRGAGEVVLVEQAPKVAQMLEEHIQLLGLEHVKLHRAEALNWLDQGGEPFDLVFLDPPFRALLLPALFSRLSAKHWLSPGALLYFELPVHGELPALPPSWSLYRDQRAGQVRYGLIQRTA